MSALTQWITEHPVVSTWITLVSLFGVLISLIALILQVKDKKKRLIYYNIASTVLIDNKVSAIDGIKIFFQNEAISSVAVSNIKLWNGGNEILEEMDFYPGYELKVVVPNAEKILAIALAEQSDEICDVKVQKVEGNSYEAMIRFCCLEPRQGATINVYHTAINEEAIKVTGKIKGGKVINRSVDMAIENGEVSMPLGKYKIYFDGALFTAGKSFVEALCQVLGISVVKRKRK